MCCVVLLCGNRWANIGYISSILLWGTELQEESLEDLDQEERENNCITPSSPRVYRAKLLLLAGATDPWFCQRAMGS